MYALLKSEYLKFIYNRWIVVTIFVTIVLVPLFTIFLHGTNSISTISNQYVLTQIIESYYLSQAGMMIITILYIGQEFTKSSLRTSLIIVPKKWQLLCSKITVLYFCLTIMWGGIVFLTFLTVKFYYSFTDFFQIVAISVPIIFESFSLFLICVSIVLISKSIVFSIGISLSFLLGLGQLLLQFSNVFLYFPINATLGLFFLSEKGAFLTSAQGIFVQFLWSLIIFIVAFFTFMNQSVR